MNRFSKNSDGNIAILFVFMSTFLFFAVGGAVDYTRWNAIREDMTQSMDSAGLALAQLAAADDTLSKSQLEAYGEQFFNENFNYESRLEPGWDINFTVVSGAEITVCITGDIKTYLLLTLKSSKSIAV